MVAVINHLNFGGRVQMNITTLGIDLAKNVFQLHGVTAQGKAVLKKKISRGLLLEFIANLPPCNIYMEACGSANFWGRQFRKFGHKVKLIHPKYVKPYVKRNKNDANDAAAIVAAARDPEMRFVDIRTVAQQDMQSIHRIRSRLVQERTALVNQIRGLLMEYGIIIPQGIMNVSEKLPEIIESKCGDLSELMLDNLRELQKELRDLDKRVEIYNRKIKNLFSSNETCKRLKSIPGIGPLGATILASMLGTGGSFKNGRHFAAFLGLTPKQHSSGGKERMLGISKGGDTYIRTLLIHGARAVLLSVSKKRDSRSCWLKSLKARKGWNRAAVAWANKMARTAWALVHNGSSYEPNYKPKLLDLKEEIADELATAL